jgi:hypothetical protein
MEKFITNFIEGSQVVPPGAVDTSFNENFPNAINVEWFRKNENFEAIFYKEGIEHIAIFDMNGTLAEYKMYLPDGFLPEKLKKTLEKKGEIMNSVMINRGNSILYEIIFRDSDLVRYLVVVNEMGIIETEKQL